MTDRSSLNDVPITYPGCCLSISKRLLTRLGEWVPKQKLTLSIGCGTGLLEAMIMETATGSVIEGVEVCSHPGPQHLSPDQIHFVNGIRDLCPKAREATAWLWVYPRHPELFQLYLDKCAGGVVESILWLGPKRDWLDYEQILNYQKAQGWRQAVVIDGETGILAEYEIAVLINRHGCPQTEQNAIDIDSI